MTSLVDFPQGGRDGRSGNWMTPPTEPPHNDDMDARLTKLEDFAVEARERLARVETKLDHVDKEVSQVKWWILAQIVAAFATVLGTGIAIQQMTVATFQAAGAQANPPAQAASQPIVVNVTSAPAGSTATGPTAKK